MSRSPRRTLEHAAFRWKRSMLRLPGWSHAWCEKLDSTFSQHALGRLEREARRLLSDRKCVAAVEFALLLPVMLTLYIGSVEVSQALNVDRRVVLLSRTVADLTTQSSRISATDISGIVSAASSVLAPLSPGDARVRVTSVAISGSGSADPKVPNKATVCWSSHSNWTAHARGAAMDTAQIPTALRTEVGTSIVLAEVQYPYTPVIGYVLTGTMTIGERIFMRPRLSTYVERSDLPNSGTPTTTGGPCT
jgi:Flp pilus assembly protein TadG